MRLHTINNILLVTIIAVNGAVIMAPFWPAVAYSAAVHGGQRQKLEAKVASPGAANEKMHRNTLIAPAMLLDTEIHEGRDTYAVLEHGVLRWPGSSTPDKGGNTVLLGHRFTYAQPRGVFYHLDKLRHGDRIALTWSGTRYTYTVREIKVVRPTGVSILEQTSDARLTLYTCTPLAWPKDRLVIVAGLDGKQ